MGDDNRRVLGLNEPQVWTLIGVFAAVMVGVLSLVYASFKSLSDGLRNELRTEMTSIRSEMMSMRNELIARMDSRFDRLDRDVAFLMRKEFGD